MKAWNVDTSDVVERPFLRGSELDRIGMEDAMTSLPTKSANVGIGDETTADACERSMCWYRALDSHAQGASASNSMSIPHA